MKKLEILESGQVRINGDGDEPDFDTLNSIFELVETIETEWGDIDLFKVAGGYIEYMGGSSFHHGESTNFTSISVAEIKEHYQNQR